MTHVLLAKVINFITLPLNPVSVVLLIVIFVQALLIANNVYRTTRLSLRSVIVHRIVEQIRLFLNLQRNANV